MYQPVTEEIPPDEFPADDSADRLGERDDLPDADHSEVTDGDADDPGVEFSSGARAVGQQHPYHHGDTAAGDTVHPRQRAWLRLQWEPHYLTTSPGIMKVLHLVVTLTALICATSICYQGNDYLSLPVPWKFRVFVFTSVFSLLSCVGLLFCRTTNVARILPLDWLLLDIILSCTISFLYFVSSCMIASASASYNQTFDADWASGNKLVAGVVLGYTLFLLYAIHVLAIYVRYKKRAQFRHQLLQVDSSSIDSMQPQV